MSRLSIVLAGLVMLWTGTALADAEPATVYLSVVSRCASSVVLERAELRALDGRTIAEVPLTRVGPFFYTGNTTVEAGHYHAGATSRRPPNGPIGSYCWGGTEISVLPGHSRRIGFDVTELGGSHYDAHAYLYGLLPFTGFVRGTLTNRVGFELPVEIDGEAYYIENAWPGDYVLRLSYGDNLECRIPVAVPEQGMGQRRDISIQDAQQCLGFPYHIPSTGERGFVPLYASPSPSPTPPFSQVPNLL